MLRKWLAVIILMMFLFTSVVSAQELTILAKTVAIEKIVYGSEQTGSAIDRVNKLELDLYGMNSQDTLLAKIDKIYSYTINNFNSAPSFVTRLNAVEWTLTHSVTAQPVSLRLDNLERFMTGSIVTGPYDGRLTSLMNLAYLDGKFAISSQLVATDTLVKIEITSPLDSRQSKVGDKVIFQAVDDVYVGGMLVVAKGAQGIGKVIKVEHAKNYGRDAQLEIAFDTIDAVDGSSIDVTLGDKAKEQLKSFQKAVGASLAGMAVLGPIGVVGGVFVQGKEKVIPVGTIMYIQTAADTTLFGIK